MQRDARRGPTFRDLTPSLRVLFTAALITLGLGFCFATLQVYETHAGRDGNPGLSAGDIALAYSGDAHGSRLQIALVGPMSGYAPSKQRRAVIDWAADGADRAEYESTIKPIIEKRCQRCHAASQWGAPMFGTYEMLAEYAKVEKGMTLETLVRISHIHLFGMTFIFFILGLIFSHARMRPAWAQPVVIALPFAMMLTDIGSWYLTKLDPGYAWLFIASGLVMGLSFAMQWGVSMYQIWFGKA